MTTENSYTAHVEYWRQAEESEGFDIENISLPSSMDGIVITARLLAFDCKGFYPRLLTKLYAKLGLHRYNMLEVRVDEGQFGTLDIACSVARPKGEETTKMPFIPHFHGGASAAGIFKGELPDWPSDDALKDQKRFYLVKKSEWQANDWISLYLELVVYVNDRLMTRMHQMTEILSQLEIVKVAIETATGDVEPPNERLKAKSVNVYIMFKGLAEPRAPQRVFEIGVDIERKAIVRRVMDEDGYLSLVGKLCGGQSTKKRSRSP
ncbi:PREDICTED: UPF0725 protein At1g23970-like isoform X2 [Camelina sativa]|uniref:UPF0725 protein At1g23970-like isoform X2 n=1 Tax=Camelina sativa TaxID=90675 RepID=A0ABM0WXT9_CAMSA|nr:PREDICTED: UPF0725 protein At1g23970-like isoform X2 [Camelina sativa]